MNNEISLKIIETLPLIITAIGTLITAVGVIIVGRWAYKAKTQTEGNTAILTTVAKKVDGLSSSLVAATSDAKFAEGQLKERDANREYQSGTPTGTEEDPVNVKPVKGKV